ncbi:PBE1, partial [Symbiodinium microadriaticum]
EKKEKKDKRDKKDKKDKKEKRHGKLEKKHKKEKREKRRLTGKSSPTKAGEASSTKAGQVSKSSKDRTRKGINISFGLAKLLKNSQGKTKGALSKKSSANGKDKKSSDHGSKQDADGRMAVSDVALFAEEFPVVGTNRRRKDEEAGEEGGGCLMIFIKYVANEPIMQRCTSKYVGVIKSQSRGSGAKLEVSHAQGGW